MMATFIKMKLDIHASTTFYSLGISRGPSDNYLQVAFNEPIYHQNFPDLSGISEVKQYNV